MAEETMLVCIRPPGRNHIQREITEYIRSPMPERFISSPMSRKRGTATRMNPVFTSKALLAMMFHRAGLPKKKSMMRERQPNAPATYMPARKKALIKPNATPMANV